MADEPFGDPFDTDETEVPVSALEHWSYCPRQCALIHVEQTFEENIFTIKGSLAHERVDAGDREIRRGVRVYRDIALWSERYGLRGKAARRSCARRSCVWAGSSSSGR